MCGNGCEQVYPPRSPGVSNSAAMNGLCGQMVPLEEDGNLSAMPTNPPEIIARTDQEDAQRQADISVHPSVP